MGMAWQRSYTFSKMDTKIMKGCLSKILAGAFVLIILAVAWKLISENDDQEANRRRDRQRAVPVEIAEVTRGSIEEQRVFSGGLEASASITIAPKISGRVLRVSGEISDPVKRGQVLVELESDELEEALARANAELAVSQAKLNEAKNRKEISERESKRIQQLSEKGISSASALDEAEAETLIRSSALEVAKANLTTRESAKKTAELNLKEASIRARWSDGDDQRIIASRTVEEGEMVSPQDSLFTVVEIQPIQAVVHVPERDYGRLSVGQPVQLTTDAWPDTEFEGRIVRMAPVFKEDSRQARVEILADNPETHLKPGMFVRARITLAKVEDALLIPEIALTRRGNESGVFSVDTEEKIAHWRLVKTGIRDGLLVEVLEPELIGHVVTLGQQLIDEGSALLLPADSE